MPDHAGLDYMDRGLHVVTKIQAVPKCADVCQERKVVHETSAALGLTTQTQGRHSTNHQSADHWCCFCSAHPASRRSSKIAEGGKSARVPRRCSCQIQGVGVEAPTCASIKVALCRVFRKWGGCFFGNPFEGILYYSGYKRGTPHLGKCPL